MPSMRRAFAVSILVVLPSCTGGSTVALDAGGADAGGPASLDATTPSPVEAGACPTYSDGDKACVVEGDCTTVGVGCHCGPEPVLGVAKRVAAAAATCEATRADECVLKCSRGPGREAEDGNVEGDGGTIVVTCDSGRCRTIVR